MNDTPSAEVSFYQVAIAAPAYIKDPVDMSTWRNEMRGIGNECEQIAYSNEDMTGVRTEEKTTYHLAKSLKEAGKIAHRSHYPLDMAGEVKISRARIKDGRLERVTLSEGQSNMITRFAEGINMNIKPDNYTEFQ